MLLDEVFTGGFMSRKGHINGGKQRGSHTTIIPAAENLVKTAERLPEVTGISPGFITTGIHSRQTRVKYKKIQAGLEVTAIGTTSKQVIYIYTNAPDRVIQLLDV